MDTGRGGRPTGAIHPGGKNAGIRQYYGQVAEWGALNQLELVRQRRDGSVIHISLSTAPLLTASGQPHAHLFLVADITQRKLAEQRIQFQALHDALTGLPNRLLLQDRFEQAKAHGVRKTGR